MVKRTRITDKDVANFAALLWGWSQSQTSCFFCQFWRSVGMSEMQFYRRVWMAQDQVPDFNLDEIKKNLKKNRFLKNQGSRCVKTAEKISINHERQEGFPEKSCKYAQEGRRL